MATYLWNIFPIWKILTNTAPPSLPPQQNHFETVKYEKKIIWNFLGPGGGGGGVQDNLKKF